MTTERLKRLCTQAANTHARLHASSMGHLHSIGRASNLCIARGPCHLRSFAIGMNGPNVIEAEGSHGTSHRHDRCEVRFPAKFVCNNNPEKRCHFRLGESLGAGAGGEERTQDRSSLRDSIPRSYTMHRLYHAASSLAVVCWRSWKANLYRKGCMCG